MITFSSQIATSELEESPTVNADRAGRQYITSICPEHKQRFGQYLTPVDVARFMAKLYKPQESRILRVLDPGAGSGTLVCALLEALAKRQARPEIIELVTYELDAALAKHLEIVLAYSQQWLEKRGIKLKSTIYTDDFVINHASALEYELCLFPHRQDVTEFDLIILNPPYFKVSKSDPRARAAKSVVHGQPNIYALFMSVSAALLKHGGVLIAITPRSYAAGSYFRLFRERFFSIMRPEAIHLFGSRRDAFKRDEVLQENIILQAQRDDGWSKRTGDETVWLSYSSGIHDLANPKQRVVLLSEVLDLTSRNKILKIPINDTDDITTKLVRSWTWSLHKQGLEISTGPVVPFRKKKLLYEHGQIPETHAPLLWMQNVQPMRVVWPSNTLNKPQYIKICPEAMPLLVSNKNYVLLRRFSAKEQRRRLTAAPLITDALRSPVIGLENHLNYIHRRHGALTEAEAYGLSAFLNSRLFDIYFRTFNGNTQVNATELRATPLPSPELIAEIGRRVMNIQKLDELDTIVEDVLSINNPTLAEAKT